MADERQPPRAYGLDARVARLERDFARLGEELALVRALVAERAKESAAAAPSPMPAPSVGERAAAKAPPASPPPPRLEPRPAAAPPSARPTIPTPPPPPPPPPRRTLGELARDWDLVGARGFAIAGGAVMALGIGLFFVLAANRGWIGPGARVALGGTASVLVFTAGLMLRARYGQYWAALAAVGAGIAGAYATLAAAAARYDLVPDALALPLAGAIAAVGTVVAMRWRSQVIAAIGLLGAALAPALQALDREMTWESAAFAMLVLAATAAVSVPRAWRELLVAVSVVVGAQIEWLAAEPSPGAGAVTVAAAFVLSLLAIAVARQVAVRGAEIDPLALGYALASFGVSLIFVFQMLEERDHRAIALLVAAAVWGAVFAATHLRGLTDLAFVVGSSALALAAVGTADLLTDTALTIAWAAEALVLAIVARKFADARLHAMSIVYAVLATVSSLVTDGALSLLFDEDADHLAGALPSAAAAAAFAGAGLLAPATYRGRTEAGLLAFLADVRRALDRFRAVLQESFVVAGAALATIAAAFLLLSLSFEWGHIASSALAAGLGAVLLSAAGARRSDRLIVAGFIWLGVVLVEALAYDGPTFDSTDSSTGAWSILAASAGITAGAYALRILQPRRRALDLVCGIAIALSFVNAFGIGIPWADTDRTSIGIGWLLLAAVHAVLSAGVLRRDSLRDFSTILWALGLAALVASEIALIEDGVVRTSAIVLTAVAVGLLSVPLRETRLWLGAAALTLGTTALSFVFELQPWVDEESLERRFFFAAALCAIGSFMLAALRWGAPGWRDQTTAVWASGIVALLAAERLALGDWPSTLFAAALTAVTIAALARPLDEQRLWVAGLALASVATAGTVAALTSPEHFFTASASPGESLWVLVGCVAALAVAAVTAPRTYERSVLPAAAATGIVALYAVSLGILELAQWISSASIDTDFERGHTAVSGLWALIGLALLLAGLLRGSALLRYGGLALFGLSLAKIFLYDLAELSSVARAFSFIFVGALLLVGGFFLQRLSDRLAPNEESAQPGT